MPTIKTKSGLRENLPAEGGVGELHYCTDSGELFAGQGPGKPLDRVSGLRKVEKTVGSAEAVHVLSHGLGTRFVDVTVFRAGAPWEELSPVVEHTGPDEVTLRFSEEALPAEGFHAVIAG